MIRSRSGKPPAEDALYRDEARPYQVMRNISCSQQILANADFHTYILGAVWTPHPTSANRTNPSGAMVGFLHFDQ